MYMSFMLYQAERVRTVREQREEDMQTGQLAAEFGRLWRSLGHRRGNGQRGFRQAAETRPVRDACSCPSTGQHAICG
jgi:hypothetical protein